MSNTLDQLKQLADLHETHAVSDDEYAALKARILADAPDETASHAAPEPSPEAPPTPEAPSPATTRSVDWPMLLHLSQYLSLSLPLAGTIVPIIIWQAKKAEVPELDAHGRIVVNWLLSELILAVIFLPLCFLLIGFPLLIGLIIAGLVYPAVGAVKAANGEAWRYPFSFTFFRS